MDNISPLQEDRITVEKRTKIVIPQIRESVNQSYYRFRREITSPSYFITLFSRQFRL